MRKDLQTFAGREPPERGGGEAFDAAAGERGGEGEAVVAGEHGIFQRAEFHGGRAGEAGGAAHAGERDELAERVRDEDVNVDSIPRGRRPPSPSCCAYFFDRNDRSTISLGSSETGWSRHSHRIISGNIAPPMLWLCTPIPQE